MKDFYMNYIFWHHNALRNWALDALGRKWYDRLSPPSWAYDILYADSEEEEIEFHMWQNEECTDCGNKNAFCICSDDWPDNKWFDNNCAFCERGVECPDHTILGDI